MSGPGAEGEVRGQVGRRGGRGSCCWDVMYERKIKKKQNFTCKSGYHVLNNPFDLFSFNKFI